MDNRATGANPTHRHHIEAYCTESLSGRNIGFDHPGRFESYCSVFQYGKVAEGTKASDCKSLQPGVRIPLLPPEHSRSTELENGQ